MAPTDPSAALRLLASIDAKLGRILELLPKRVADASELDSHYGNPIQKLTPHGWKGASFKDRRMSECSPEYLDLAAKMYDYMADKAEAEGKMTTGDKPKPMAPYKRLDAALARGWAARIRAGHVPSAAEPGLDDMPAFEDDMSAFSDDPGF